MTGWIDAREKKPEYHHDVLVLIDDGEDRKTQVGCWGEIQGKWSLLYIDDDREIDIHVELLNVTHWMYLPELPEKKHFCEGYNNWVCVFIDEDQSRFKITQRYNGKDGVWFVAQFCPFCGEEA